MTTNASYHETFSMAPSTALLAISTLALIVIDLAHFSVPTAIGATVLALIVGASIVRRSTARFGMYAFFGAELGPISLQADVLTAFAYQAACMLLLTAAIAPFPRVSNLSIYALPALKTSGIAAAILALALLLRFPTWPRLAALQASWVSGIVLLIIVGILLFVPRETILSQPLGRG